MVPLDYICWKQVGLIGSIICIHVPQSNGLSTLCMSYGFQCIHQKIICIKIINFFLKPLLNYFIINLSIILCFKIFYEKLLLLRIRIRNQISIYCLERIPTPQPCPCKKCSVTHLTCRLEIKSRHASVLET